MEDDPLQALWMTEEEPLNVDLNKIRAAHRTFLRQIRQRNAVEMLAAGVAIATFGAGALSGVDWLLSLGSGLIALGAAFVAAVLYQREHPTEADPSNTTGQFVAERREALHQQARLLETVPLWYVGPFVPGAALIYGAVFPGLGDPTLLARWGLSASVALGLVGFVIWLNWRAAAALRREMADLPSFD